MLLSVNARKEADLVNPNTGAHLELDVFVPSLRLAFEYQEQHHYIPSDNVFRSSNYYTQRDAMKKQLAEAKGITFITVPCWWDGKQDR